jgi:hypothetical protein
MLQIGPRIPEAVRRRWGYHHMVDEEGLEQRYLRHLQDARDLLDEPRFVRPLLDICREWPDWDLR